MSYRDVYLAAAAEFAGLVTRLTGDDLAGPGLGEWSLRDLIGHAVSSGLRQVPAVLATRAGSLVVRSPEAYWAFARTAPADLIANAVAASHDDARESGRALGEDPAGAVRQLVGAATAALAAARDDDVVESAAGGMRVADWMPTSTFELVVHGMDVAAAAELDFAPSAEVMAEVAAQTARVAVAVGDGPLLLRALTGRATLPAAFTVVG